MTSIGIIAVSSHINEYKLNPKAAALIGPADQAILKKVYYLGSSHSWILSDLAPQSPDTLTIGTGPNKIPCGFNLPQALSHGISVTDPQTQLSMTMIPEGKASPGKLINQYFIYPLGYQAQAVYTVKQNGLLGDMVLPHGSRQTLFFNYRLKLPDTLAARMLPGGSVGIYSANPVLYGKINYGSDSKDQALLNKGKTSAPKTNLVFVIPLPTIKSTSDNSAIARAVFKLRGSQLSLAVSNSGSIKSPLVIDPSVVVVSASMLTNGNNEGGIGCLSSDYICEGGLTGGVPQSWTNIASGTGALVQATYQLGAVAYNGYLYAIGGYNGASDLADVQYAGLQTIPRASAYSYLVDASGLSNSDPQPLSILINGSATGNPGIGSSGPGGIQVQYQVATNACATFSSKQALQMSGGKQLGVPWAISISHNGCGSAIDLGRFIFLRFILDDSQTATFPDNYSNHTSITSFTLYYHPATNYRLKNGATFGNGSLQSLDAPPTPATP